jgi:hypothetical protein
MQVKIWRSRSTSRAKSVQARPSLEQDSLRGGWNHVVRRVLVFKATNSSTPNPTPEPVLWAFERAQTTENMKTARQRTMRQNTQQSSFRLLWLLRGNWARVPSQRQKTRNPRTLLSHHIACYHLSNAYLISSTTFFLAHMWGWPIS